MRAKTIRGEKDMNKHNVMRNGIIISLIVAISIIVFTACNFYKDNTVPTTRATVATETTVTTIDKSSVPDVQG